MRRPDFSVSVIIPLYVIDKRFFDGLQKFKSLDFRNFEVLVVTDKKIKLSDMGNVSTRVILTRKDTTGPAYKRDLALKYAKGEICAFIDDDAYPDCDWLKKSVRHFKDKHIVAVGGPGVTPPEDGYWEKLAGLALESIFLSGAAQHRFVPLFPRFLDDWPAYNLLVRKQTLEKVGGYGNDFYGGEDTFLCLKLVKEGKIYYEPGAMVYHHRRKLFAPFLRQIANVGLHRGYFAKRFPETSRKPFYFLPSILAVSLFFYVILVLLFPWLLPIFVLSVAFFVLLGAVSVIDKISLFSTFLVGLGIVLSHIAYGVFFIKGLFTSDLKH